MKTMMSLLICLLFAVMTGCSGIDSRQSFDTKADFTSLKTYAWSPGVERSFSQPRYGDYFMTVTDKIMESKGFTRSSDSPDFWIEIPPSDRFKEVYSTAHGPVEFHQGKLIIQMREGSSKDLIWEGVAKVLMSEKYTPKEIEDGIQEATEELLKGFPPEQ